MYFNPKILPPTLKTRRSKVSMNLIYIIDVCFTKIEDRHCVDNIDKIEKKSTLQAALAKCAGDANCGKVYDFTCDYNGQFYFCAKNATDFFSDKRLTHSSPGSRNLKKRSSCIFVKENDSGNCWKSLVGTKYL